MTGVYPGGAGIDGLLATRKLPIVRCFLGMGGRLQVPASGRIRECVIPAGLVGREALRSRTGGKSGWILGGLISCAGMDLGKIAGEIGLRRLNKPLHQLNFLLERVGLK